MKKAGIITRHFINNYGSFLQSKCTIDILKDLGVDAEIINYIPKEESFFRNDLSLCRAMHIEGVKKLIYLLLIANLHRISRFFFDKFRNKNLTQSKKYNEKTIAHCSYDIYLAGSDQLWGPIGTKKYDTNYFLAFTKSKNKIAYSCSFGHTDYSCINDEVRDLLQKFKCIGVREQTAQTFLSSMGINSNVVLDPTLLKNVEYFERFTKRIKTPKEKYILIYQLHANRDFDAFVATLKQNSPYKIHRVTPNPARFFSMGKTHLTVNPYKFLALIQHSEFVLTDSFHATVFSVLFHKHFLAISPGKTATRIVDFVNLLGLSKCFTENPTIEQLNTNINFTDVDHRLNELREFSLKFLRDAIAQCITQF